MIMVVRKEKGTRKKRGSKWYGWGSKKKHRGSGSRGGHGFAGSLGHNRIWVQQNYPDHIGKDGFARPQKAIKEVRIINVCDLERLAKGNTVNLTEMGYGKLLAKGKVTKALKVTVASCTPSAKGKIEKAGGAVMTA